MSRQRRVCGFDRLFREQLRLARVEALGIAQVKVRDEPEEVLPVALELAGT
jgi:hypothetical protein